MRNTKDNFKSGEGGRQEGGGGLYVCLFIVMFVSEFVCGVCF